MPCLTCPEAVLSTLRRKVRGELDKLRAILSLARMFNEAFADLVGTAVEDADSAVDGIPDPVSLGFLDILAYATCPLTPLALGLGELTELTNLDPQAQLARIKDLSTGDIDDARSSYENVLENSVNAKLIKQARRFEREMRRLRFDADSFAEALVIAATVQSVCGQEEFQFGPFQEFATLADGFSFVGGVPGILNQNLAALVQKLAQGEAKFKALRGELT